MYAATLGAAGSVELTYVSEYNEEFEYEPWEEEECDYFGGPCIDSDCRDIESCLGCELLYPAEGEGDVHE